jgi:hypothetical protein
MSATACWLAVLSAAGLLTAVIMTRAARRTPAPPALPARRPSGAFPARDTLTSR